MWLEAELAGTAEAKILARVLLGERGSPVQTLPAADGESARPRQRCGGWNRWKAGALDAALVSLSLEQRIAVKAQLMRSWR